MRKIIGVASVMLAAAFLGGCAGGGISGNSMLPSASQTVIRPLDVMGGGIATRKGGHGLDVMGGGIATRKGGHGLDVMGGGIATEQKATDNGE